MLLLYAGLTLGTIGKLILGIAVFCVHARMRAEHKIDNAVVRAIDREKLLTTLAIILIVLGYLLEMVFYSVATITIS